MDILNAALVLGVMGAVFGLLLAIASRVFAVEVDERQELISAELPGANCGGCGFAGCSAYAAAIVAGKAEINKCAAGGNECAAAIAGIMGVEASATERCVATVKCSGKTDVAKKKFVYSGVNDCLAAMRLGGGQGPNECPQGCIGLGTCVAACNFGALSIVDGIAHVDHEKCVGCMACMDVCPKKVIVKVPYEADITVLCASNQKGAALRKYCNIGCLGCKICEKNCPNDAIHVVDNLAYIDYSKCTSCGICAQKCPRHLIADAKLNTENDIELTVPVVTKPE